MCTPANTPATPPNFPDALTMFSRLKASESFNSGSGGSPMAASMATSPPPPQVGGWGVSPNVPQPPMGLWTQGQPPTQPCPAWPTGVNPHGGTEQKASVVMEAERWRAAQDWEAPLPTPPGEGRKVGIKVGRGGEEIWVKNMGFGLSFPKVGWTDGKRWKLRKPRKTQRGQFKKRRKPMQTSIQK